MIKHTQQYLLGSRAPFVHLFIADEPHPIPAMDWPILPTASQCIRRLNAHRCGTVASMMHEVAAAWQFPDHFGDNWNALADCLRDLTWINSSSLLTLVRQGHLFLKGEPDSVAKDVVALFAESSKYQAHPDLMNMESSPRSFHTVFVVSLSQSDAFIKRFGITSILT